MTDAQAHRGPDGEGRELFKLAGGVLVLGHRRLSILDLSEAGRQPMVNEGTGDWLTYNGEIYNYPELRRQFERDGVALKSRCDTEIILHAYAKWGVECFRELKGMFAVAIYDARNQRLVLARDPLGIKPLYHTHGGRGFAFASEVLALRAGGVAADRIDRQALAGLLAYGSVPGPLTMFEGVRLLEPGARLIVDMTQSPAEVTVSGPESFWDFPRRTRDLPRKSAIEGLGERLKQSVRSHLLSDVPVGVFLSSGMDSTAIAALAAGKDEGQVNTFTVGLADQPDLDESAAAAATAELFGTWHRNITLSKTETRDLAAGWFRSIDQPSIDGLNTYVISWAVRQEGIKVALSGLGGDEVLAGYKTFRQVPKLLPWLKLSRLAPRTLRAWAAGLMFARWPTVQRAKAIEYATTRASIAGLALRRRRLFSDRENEALGLGAERLGLSADYLLHDMDPDRQVVGMDPVSAISVIESRYYMGNTLLRDSDACGMAHGLEIRVPMLDRELVEFVLSVPGHLRVGADGANKPLLFEALGEAVFRDIPFQRKRGFALPCAAWMAGPLREQFEGMFGEVKRAGVVDDAAVDRVWRDFLADQRATNWTRAWLLGVLGAWLARTRT